MGIQRIACPSCGGSDFTHDDAGNMICRFCGAQYASPREEVQCHVCGTVNPPQARRCMNCGLILGRQCPVCTHLNPPGADHCENCASPLDTLTSVMVRQSEQQDGAVVARTERLAATKQDDLAYMSEQRARLQAEERERLALLAARRAAARKEQQMIIAIVLGAMGFLILLIAIVALILSS